jgi:hypothetical protein
LLIRRYGYLIEDYRLSPEGTCPACHAAIPGRWSKKFDAQIASIPFVPRERPRLVRIHERN